MGPDGGPPDDMTPQHGIPRATPPGGTPYRGVPRVRDGHPEQPEQGGGWSVDPEAAPGPREYPTGPVGGPRLGVAPRMPGGPALPGDPVHDTGAQPGLHGPWGGARYGGPDAALTDTGGHQFDTDGYGADPGAVGTDTGAQRLPGPRLIGPRIPGPQVPGPRQEYIDAFDDDQADGRGNDDDVNVFAPRRGPRARTTTGSGPLSPPEPEGRRAPDDDQPGGAGPAATSRTRRAGAPHDRAPGDPDEDLPTDGPEAASPPREEDGEPSRARGAKRNKGRTFTGIAAAAVTTVLAVVVAGQVTHGRGGGAPSRSDREHSDAKLPQHPDEPRHVPAPKPLTYQQKMDKVYPFDPDMKASGSFRTVPGHVKAPRSGAGRVYRYRVDVEKGLGLDAQLFADAVQKTLNDQRSWAHGGQRAFERISSGKPDFVITLASPGTTDDWCAKSGLDTSEDTVSCDSAATDRVMINAYRWAEGAETYGDDAIHAYRQMLINHEVGHRIGYDHVVCTKNGALAPVMQQQTKFLTYRGITCRPNPWPYPKK